MSGSSQPRIFSESLGWLLGHLRDDDIEMVVPKGDPIRVWWEDTSTGRTARLLEVVSGANDVLTWLALIDAVRARMAKTSHLDQLFTEAISEVARSNRTMNYPAQFDAFLSYSHRDMGRAALIVNILAEQGVRVFHDVRDIEPGESILGKLHAAMTHARRAILLVSENYAKSVWAHRELSLLREGQIRRDLLLLPVLLDDVPLPGLIEDVFTIDLRGFRGSEDLTWATERLIRLSKACK
jgi:hypothetical protein